MNLENKIETFFHKVDAEAKHLFTTNVPTWVGAAASTITFVAPRLEGVLAFYDPAALAVVTPLITKAQSALAAASVVIKSAGPAPTLATYLNAVTANLSQVLTAAQVKDPATAAKLTGEVSLITGEVNAILGALPASK